MKFVDKAKIFVTAGKGGNGCISFRREKFVPRGGPDGGDGGPGGSVFLSGKKELSTLYDLKIKPHYKAGHGSHGKGKKMTGRAGKDIYISVPLGVVVYNGKKIIGEILSDKQKLLIAQGGKGGRGNTHFVSATMRTPRIAEPGFEGEEKTVKLVLKLISDIGLVGFPNAGKSTLLHAITNAQPKIADYPFTTLNPNLGVLKANLKNIIIADMPGIIKDAHTGKGLGIQFLRHIERTKKILLVIDITSPQPLHQYQALLNEFRAYSQKLLKKPRMVIFNKIDRLNEIPEFKIKEKTFYISALKKTGINQLISFLNNEDKT